MVRVRRAGDAAGAGRVSAASPVLPTEADLAVSCYRLACCETALTSTTLRVWYTLTYPPTAHLRP